MLVFIGSTVLGAQNHDVVDSIAAEMDKYRSIATKTRENEHYQPYVISVFHGKELERLGVSNLKEALTLVPGADMATDNFNNQTPIFRGSNPLAFGQSILFIDGVLVNNLFFDSYSEYLALPIEMVKRIEIVRGPGSKTEGVNAYAGSINVVTYAEDIAGLEENDKIVLKGGSYDYKMGGFAKTYRKGDFRLFADFFYQEDDKKLSTGPDALEQGLFSIAPIDNTGLSRSGEAPLWLKNHSLGLTLKYKEFSLRARTLGYKQGSAYGYLYMLPEDDDYIKLPSHYIELGYDRKMGDYEVAVDAGAKYGAFDNQAKVAPDGFQLMSAVTFDEGMYAEYYAQQRTLYHSAFLKYSGVQDHKFSLGYRLVREETTDMAYKLSNLSTGDALPLVDYTLTRPFFNKDARRDTYVIAFQDEYSYSGRISFIYGFNYENTSLRNAGFNPRASVVYQYDTKNIFKIIYSRSHRNPSWQEMFIENRHVIKASKDLDPERVNAYEAAYIRKFSSNSHLQANIFYLCNKDQIHNTTAHPDYENTKDSDIYGMELEYRGDVTPDDQFYLNYSYVDSESNSGADFENTAHHMVKSYYVYNLNDDFSLSTVVKYVGSKERESEDTREKLKSYSTFDASLHYEDPVYDYSLTFSARNIFDATVKYPSANRTYRDDYRQEGSNYMVTLRKRF